MKAAGTFKVRKDLFAEFEQLQPGDTYKGKPWTDESDEVIRRYWRKTYRPAFVKLFCEKFFPVSKSVLNVRARKLGV